MARFLAAHEGVSGCWLWHGSPNRDGYGLTKLNGVTTIAHRVAFRLACGPIPPGMAVCHTCDNRRCVKPAHLFLGTQRDNIADCIAKGRFPRGIRNGVAKLTEEQVRAIRQDRRTQMQIAAAFGISQSVVSAVRLRQRYADVSD